LALAISRAERKITQERVKIKKIGTEQGEISVGDGMLRTEGCLKVAIAIKRPRKRE